MCVAQTCKRKRRQAANHYRHLSKQRRPSYKMSDAGVSARRLAALIEKQRAFQQRKGKKK